MHNVDIIDSKYKIIDEDCARYGGTSVVYKVVNDNKDILALKLFNNDRRDNDVINISFNRELELLEELNEHEHIINLLDWGFDKEIGNKYLVFNWYEKNLFDVYNLISGWDSFYEEYGKIILEALVFAYGRNIVHRDIKPENILLNDSYDIQIADFGIAKIKKFLLDPSKTLAFHGTLLYKPEEFNKINFNSSNSDDRRDVYGFTAMCLNVFANGILQNRNDLLNYLENEFDCTEEVYNVFKKSLNLEENDFYGNITDLYDDLQETYYKRKRYFEKSRVLILSPTNVISKIKNEEDDLNDESLVEEILNELNDCCLIDAYRKDNEIQKNFYIFRTTEYDYQVLIDNTGDYFVIVNRWKIFIEQIEKHRDKFYESNFEFYDITKEITKQESSKSINDFQNEFNRFLNDTKNKYLENIKKEIFYKWKNQLELQEDIKSQNNPSINYNNFEINGNEIHFHVDTAPEYKFIQEDEEWMIGEIKDIIKGPLIDVSNNSVTMMCRFFNKKNIPEKGVLRHNFMPTIKSLYRQ